MYVWSAYEKEQWWLEQNLNVCECVMQIVLGT